MMKQLNPTPINPKGFTNTDNITGVFGAQVPNTFTRDVSPTVNTPRPLPADYLNTPVPPPAGVETPITPNYDINGY